MMTIGKRHLLIVAFVLSFLLSSHTPVFADDTISVTGDAVVLVVPDQVIIALGIETWNLDLTTAKRQNDDIIGKLKDVANKYGIKPEQLQTDFINIEPRYEDSYEKRRFIGYFVRKTMIVTLKDITKFDDVLSDSLTAGANYVHGIEFRTSELRKYRDQARSLAINAAREKAEALSKALGRKISKPLNIQESGVGWYSSYGSYWGSRWSGGQSQNVIQNAGGGSSTPSDTTIALGQITVSASVSVTFALEPDTKAS